jgi:uncharacterized protein (TIGR01777 family)
MLPGVWTHLAATSVTQGDPMKQADTQSPVVIAGGSGFLGMSLARFLTSAGRRVVILSRSAPPPGPWTHRAWDGRTLGDWAAALNGASGIVNLAGRTVDCVKTPLHCDQILRSRVESTLALGEACRRAAMPPPVWVQMSTAHIYGDSELPCDESSPFGYGLAPTVGRAWEEAFNHACPSEVRRVVLRTSFVLARHDGPLPTLARLARFGLGGTIASGTQGMSWIHETDMNRLFDRALTEESMHGAFIATAPNPVSNRDFMQSLRRAVHAPIGLPLLHDPCAQSATSHRKFLTQTPSPTPSPYLSTLCALCALCG